MDKLARGLPADGVAVDADRVACLHALEGEQAGRAGIGEPGDVVHSTSWGRVADEKARTRRADSFTPGLPAVPPSSGGPAPRGTVGTDSTRC